MNILKQTPPPPPPHPPFDVIVLQLEPADEVMEDSDRGECLTLCPLKDSGVVEVKPVCEVGEVRGNNVGVLLS